MTDSTVAAEQETMTEPPTPGSAQSTQTLDRQWQTAITPHMAQIQSQAAKVKRRDSTSQTQQASHDFAQQVVMAPLQHQAETQTPLIAPQTHDQITQTDPAPETHDLQIQQTDPFTERHDEETQTSIAIVSDKAEQINFPPPQAHRSRSFSLSPGAASSLNTQKMLEQWSQKPPT